MFEFSTNASPAPALGALKAAVPAMAFAFGLAAASAGHAESIFLQTASMNTTYTAHIYSAPYPSAGYSDEYVYLAPMTFTAYDGVGATGDAYSLLAFCVDIFHNISLGNINLQYDDTQPLASNSGSPSTPLTGAQLTQVGKLVNYGQVVYGSADADKVAKLAGLQGAIWQVINPTYTVKSFNGAVDGYIGSYSDALTYGAAIADHGPVGSSLTFITETGKYGTADAHQSFAFAPAPEPGVWMLLIAGFGMTGAALRRSRSRPAAVRA
ncbi:MAG: hypothetical protein KKE02_08040 [Alphaproteobacteria bacterium]|nr:hypothetical protein [Alphaproteobacteria bacterium]MBU1515662.1 hypothetical protein [Alphaproteobacteria bacterium]MBU2094921.1 hypothetical protein [Alphaproteobacteria bacterium]MBU2150953.1 hypothetical protein [Alphaproteobacteria bacterium]MBU2305930.1 hypothetical protein [Alphaproteobacteria bacterium]